MCSVTQLDIINAKYLVMPDVCINTHTHTRQPVKHQYAIVRCRDAARHVFTEVLCDCSNEIKNKQHDKTIHEGCGAVPRGLGALCTHLNN